ncbi:Plasmid partition protein B [Serratia entomophila]|uniref:ParB/RepB/Spo0J family plasmid partition protein n=1 Tax=Serratia TaxID=613 RepID=UPI001F4BFCF7|nr:MULTISPECIES: ParB/RepB/Spo0J family plasmid partition protein [Serratia]ULG10248.1 ParB [Serratia entomophila]ULG10527.1 ParB [Serratia entomophila]ULG10746.1 ParB [Serratia entomophila]ULG11747.1 ParB [Serratia entomophila]ULG11892.1 ParB [Serratia entomophila]
MKRAPVLRHAPTINFDEANAVPVKESELSPSAPAVSQLSSRVSGMKGNSITLPVCGEDVTFVLKTIASDQIEVRTTIFAGNERLQDLLTESSLDDLLPSFLTSGQQSPAFGRSQNGLVEIADGSRRRKAAILTSSEYKVLVGELSDAQMRWLSQIGNDYRPTSAYERGLRYARRLFSEFSGNVSHLAEAENISRKIIQRCIKTAELPIETLQLFANPNELSARSGEMLYKFHASDFAALKLLTQTLHEQQSEGATFSTEELLKRLMPVTRTKSDVTVRKFAIGIEAKYSEKAVSFNLTDAPASLVERIEMLLAEHAKTQE